MRQQEKAAGLPWRKMSGANVALTWFRSPSYAGDPLAQARLPLVRGGPGLGGPQKKNG